MKPRTFKGELLSGHKEGAIEVPFNPAEAWGIEPKPLWRGRRGHAVKGKLNGREFSGFIVPRQKTFYLLIDQQLRQAAGIAEGDLVAIAVEPSLN